MNAQQQFKQQVQDDRYSKLPPKKQRPCLMPGHATQDRNITGQTADTTHPNLNQHEP